MALGFVSSSDSLIESLHSHHSPSIQHSQTTHSHEAQHRLHAPSASPGSENQYSEIGTAMSTSSVMSGHSAEYEGNGQPRRGSAHDLRSAPDCPAAWTKPRHHSADVLGPTPFGARSAQHQPHVTDARRQHRTVAPPKPRRLYAAPPAAGPTGGATTSDIYTMPTTGPRDAADHRRTWSPLVPQPPGRGQLHKMRCYRSNEQLDITEAECEQLDTISNSSAPPKIAPLSGKLNKMSPDDIIKPVAFKPIITPMNRFTPCRPSPAQQSSWTQPMTSDLNRSHDDGYQSQEGNHRDRRPVTASQQMTLDLAALTSSQCDNGDGLAQVVGQDGHGGQAVGTASPSALHASLGRPGRPTGSALCRSSLHAACSPCNPAPEAGRPSETGCGSSSRAGHVFAGVRHGSLDGSWTCSAHAGHAHPEASQSLLNVSHASSNPSHGCSSDGSYASVQTSPACGVDELEARLRKKEAELRRLRETMDRNERALLQVYEEKRQNWEAELRDRCNDWEQKMDAAWRKSFRTEQALLAQLFKLQEDRRALRKDNEKLRSSSEKLEQRCAELEQQLQQANTHVDELNWELQQRSGEISLLKIQLKDEKEQASTRGAEMVTLRAQIKELREECDQLRDQADSANKKLEQTQEEAKRIEDALKSQLKEAEEQIKVLKEQQRKEAERQMLKDEEQKSSDLSGQIALLTAELARTRSRLAEVEEEFTREKAQWLSEKDKVIRYQKHLQLNYIQAMRKNKLLEDDVEQLTLELEQHNIKLMANPAVAQGAAGSQLGSGRGPGITLMEEEESIC